MNVLFWIYVFVALIAIIGPAAYFQSIGEDFVAGICLVQFVIASFYFGTRWFPPANSVTKSTDTWPPVMNYCPDFLSLYTINGKQVCIDTIGVAQTGGISQWTDPAQTDEKYQFNLYLDSSAQERTQKLCQQAKLKRVTWEGVWDGTICIGKSPPLPPPPATPGQ